MLVAYGVHLEGQLHLLNRVWWGHERLDSDGMGAGF